jgi:sodium transport system permease protein
VNVRDVWVFYRQELRSALRERNIVIYSIILPLLLYPLLLWLVFTAITFVRGQTEGEISQVAVVNLPPEHAGLREQLAASERLRLVDVPADGVELVVRAGRLDAAVVVSPAEAPDGTSAVGTLRTRIVYDASKDASRTAQERLSEQVERYRAAWLEREAAARGIAPDVWRQYAITTVNEASARDIGALVLKVLLPSLLLAMIALGCFYPAIDATAGERERSTWETTMTLAASRTSILTAKYLYVATLGVVAGLLNVVAIVVSLGPMLRSIIPPGSEGVSFQLPLQSIPVVALGAILIALFVAAGMMIAASFARTFKEGQTMVSPFYFVLLLPVMFLQSPELELTLPLALIPVVNVTLMFRDAIGGVYNWPLIGVTVVVELALIALCLALARRILQFEDVLVGSFNGSFFTFAKERLLGRSTQGDPA